VETEETEGVTDDLPVSEETGSEAEADGHKRKRRRRRRGRPGEAREGGPARDNNDAARVPFDTVAIPRVVAEESESDEDESDEQPGAVRTDQAAGGERRPRRRGRRGGRRRRGGLEDGLAGSIVDELRPAPAPEAASAVADFDGNAAEPPAPEDSAPIHRTNAEPQQADRGQQDAAHSSAEVETAQEAERAARRRSTVREKVSFLVDAQRDAAPPFSPSQPEPPAPPAQPPSRFRDGNDTQPRRAGWWSRRFGNGE